MIKFFRHIRQRYISEGKTTKYFKYAIGEILLVVIGILIALQINNWNEVQKGKMKATTILEAIRSDMVKDLERIEDLKPYWGKEIVYFKKVFPSYTYPIDMEIIVDMETVSQVNYSTLFDYDAPFRSNTSAFDAMIADGNSDLITNDTLFSNIQKFYTFNVPTNENLFEILRERSSDLNYKYAHIITYKPYKNISDLTDEYLIADLNIYFRSKNFYYWRTFIINQESLTGIIAQIDKELE
ncbi:DUF6090 family protein [Psychroserpens luteus]|uniref:DUF6090 family protein n=1 Tax=Psychroserpens luteus TaxID=1434066 RepID=A0ABW5ZY24_9FLAO|nr:DUF6090 family protein [Psychroserpens luteus]